MVEAFVPSAYFLQVLRRAALSRKMLRWRRRERLFEPTLRGCSSVVEHLLAKEDVASSSLVTRSSLRLVRSANRRLERARCSRGEGGSPDRIQATAGKPVRDFAVVLRLHFAIEIRAEPAIHWSDARSQEAIARSPGRTISAYREIRSVAYSRVLRICR